MSIEWIRKTYDVPAKRGGRIEYTGGSKPKLGTILGASGGHLIIHLDGVPFSTPFHPTWEIRYLDEDADAGRAALAVSERQRKGGV